MYIQQKDLLWLELDNNFIEKFIDASVQETCQKGMILFKEGDPADFFFILNDGRIRLNLGRQGLTTYLVSHPGESFGWSGLVGRKYYSASAECIKTSTVTRLTKDIIKEITEADPLNGMKFYKRLALMLGNRLIHSYHFETNTLPRDLSYSFGSGQTISSYTTS